jgi:hypothetical protein
MSATMNGWHWPKPKKLKWQHMIIQWTEEHNSTRILTASDASFAALNLLERCWFILARGATPSVQSAYTSEQFQQWHKVLTAE